MSSGNAVKGLLGLKLIEWKDNDITRQGGNVFEICLSKWFSRLPGILYPIRAYLWSDSLPPKGIRRRL